ncbi:hypothetical protein GCM10009007_00200 [Formosimonas limnophila]|uniref:Uncharacterized protein n=1 Tax=Formosimonas limnophila TaxID=1384487 RepID=A0A8J3CJ88_9BURK|nr:hypothetical protein [Formosimonas limnophila]GHA63869.1 hypothetical protein GCM10009007_00200 [Formosimonas limnophila]
MTLKLPKFAPQAAQLWSLLSIDDKRNILENVYCSHCKNVTTMFNASGKAEKGSLILNGQCAVCMNPVGRYIEADAFR